MSDPERFPQVDLDKEVVLDANGERITAERAEAWAREISEKVGPRGRPSLSAAGSQSPRVSFRVPQDIRAEVERVASDLNVTVSALARKALEEYLKAQGWTVNRAKTEVRRGQLKAKKSTAKLGRTTKGRTKV
jgi:predicted transcriptional regulator